MNTDLNKLAGDNDSVSFSRVNENDSKLHNSESNPLTSLIDESKKKLGIPVFENRLLSEKISDSLERSLAEPEI